MTYEVPPKLGHVYVLEAAGLNRAKIGWSASVMFRTQDIRLASPVELVLLTTIQCFQQREFHLHRRFNAYRVWPKREWFHIEGELADWLAPHREGTHERYLDRNTRSRTRKG